MHRGHARRDGRAGPRAEGISLKRKSPAGAAPGGGAYLAVLGKAGQPLEGAHRRGGGAAVLAVDGHFGHGAAQSGQVTLHAAHRVAGAPLLQKARIAGQHRGGRARHHLAVDLGQGGEGVAAEGAVDGQGKLTLELLHRPGTGIAEGPVRADRRDGGVDLADADKLLLHALDHRALVAGAGGDAAEDLPRAADVGELAVEGVPGGGTHLAVGGDARQRLERLHRIGGIVAVLAVHRHRRDLGPPAVHPVEPGLHLRAVRPGRTIPQNCAEIGRHRGDAGLIDLCHKSHPSLAPLYAPGCGNVPSAQCFAPPVRCSSHSRAAKRTSTLGASTRFCWASVG